MFLHKNLVFLHKNLFHSIGPWSSDKQTTQDRKGQGSISARVKNFGIAITVCLMEGYSHDQLGAEAYNNV